MKQSRHEKALIERLDEIFCNVDKLTRERDAMSDRLEELKRQGLLLQNILESAKATQAPADE